MELGRRPGGVALVASRAIGRRCHVVSILAGGVGTVMTTGAIGRRVQRAVIGFGAGPDGGRLMATLATCGGCQMRGRLRRRHGAVVASGTPCAHGHIGMQLGRQPTARSTLVAACAVGRAGNMIGVLAGGLCAIVAVRTNGCRGKARMVHLGRWQPSHRLVTGVA